MNPDATDMHDDSGDCTDEGLEPSPLRQNMDFHKWAICLPRWITRCRTAFSWHLAKSFTASWQVDSLPSATFPLPAPHPGCFDRSGPGLSKLKLQTLAKQRVLHILVYCLNYLYLGRHPSALEIGRRPNAWHFRCFQRLRSLLVACGANGQTFPVVPGRSGPELGAAIFQLENFLAKNEELTQSEIR